MISPYSAVRFLVTSIMFPYTPSSNPEKRKIAGWNRREKSRGTNRQYLGPHGLTVSQMQVQKGIFRKLVETTRPEIAKAVSTGLAKRVW